MAVSPAAAAAAASAAAAAAASRFESVWRWALAVELGLSPQQLSRLSAVLLVHQDMTAAEVRHDRQQ
jgi:hypothetical protein